ncbi:hypothetical protein [Mesorhizobium sp.]|uniref:hypothetical protein n=1 Tax=Mesorhizobium sp. TaxID=1871066 RepID=UPI0025FC272D|nr:hypothetical protein [Mesorhizobium sp.]
MADRSGVVTGKSKQRSKITNGSATVAADGRTIWVRRLRDLIEAHEQDLGGTDNLNQAQRSLVRRAATLSVELERMEATFATAGKISAEDLDAYQRASNTLRRHLEMLGLKAPAKLQPPELSYGIVTNGRVIREVRDNIDEYAIAVGRKESKYDAARRIAYAVAQAKETGEPLPDLVADLAVQLRLADYADGEPGPDDPIPEAEPTPVTDLAPVPGNDTAAPVVWEHIQVKAGGIL